MGIEAHLVELMPTDKPALDKGRFHLVLNLLHVSAIPASLFLIDPFGNINTENIHVWLIKK